MKLWRPFKWDKANHMLYGGSIYVFIRLLSHLYPVDIFSPFFALIAVVIAGFGIEIYQGKTKTGMVELWDAIATIMPGICLAILETIITWIV